MRSILHIAVVFIFLSCTSRTIYKKPNDLISKGQMIDLWTDIYIAQGARSVKNKKLERKVNYMPFVYEKYKIDSARFMRSNIYYTSKVEIYEEMFQKVEKRLNDLLGQYDPDMAGNDPNLPRWKRDSIRRAREFEREEAPEILLREKSTPPKKIIK